jgi:hypothetical protein
VMLKCGFLIPALVELYQLNIATISWCN